MIDEQGYVLWAAKSPGPANKVYNIRNSGKGIVCHSIEGGWVAAMAELMNPDREASWMFTNLKDGRFFQHYPITASPWASGNRLANTSLWSVESEGRAGEPLNDLQVRNMLRLCETFEQVTQQVATRASTGRTVWQHNEVYSWSTPNAGPTACPSNRYDPFFVALLEEDMPDPRVDELIKEVEMLRRIVGGPAANDYDLLVSIQNQQRAFTGYIETTGPRLVSLETQAHVHGENQDD